MTSDFSIESHYCSTNVCWNVVCAFSIYLFFLMLSVLDYDGVKKLSLTVSAASLVLLDRKSVV